MHRVCMLELTVLVLWISAPCSINALTTSIFPFHAALCNGVFPPYIQTERKNNVIKLIMYQLATYYVNVIGLAS